MDVRVCVRVPVRVPVRVRACVVPLFQHSSRFGIPSGGYSVPENVSEKWKWEDLTFE